MVDPRFLALLLFLMVTGIAIVACWVFVLQTSRRGEDDSPRAFLAVLAFLVSIPLGLLFLFVFGMTFFWR